MKVYIEFANYYDGDSSREDVLAVRTKKDIAWKEIKKYEKDLKEKIAKAIIEYNTWCTSETEYELSKETKDLAYNDFINCTIMEIELDVFLGDQSVRC